MNPTSSPCQDFRNLFSTYLDGAISGRQMQSVAAHLESCAGCRDEFETLRGMQQVLGAVGPLKAPEDLGLKLRLAISHENARRNHHWWDSFSVRWENSFRPFLVQASCGLASALVLIGTLATLVGVVAVPQAVLANDEPLGALTRPHLLYSTARLQPVITSSDATVVVQADINSEGRVYNYQFLTGPVDPATEQQIRDQLLVQVYEPARVFGQPVRGHVLLTFSGISVLAHS